MQCCCSAINLKCLFYFYFLTVWSDRHTPADILISFICIYFPLLLSPLLGWSGVFLPALFEGYIVVFPLCLCSWSLWPECFQRICTFPLFESWSVSILVLLENFSGELSIISYDDWWTEKPWITGLNPLTPTQPNTGTLEDLGRKSVVAHFDLLSHPARGMQGELMVLFGLYPDIQCCRHIHFLLTVVQLCFFSLFVPRSGWFCSFLWLVEAG